VAIEWFINYEVHPANKLQNGVSLLIFKILKIQNIFFVHNLIRHMKFFDDNVISHYYDVSYT